MGMILSRMAKSREEISWYYLYSLFQVEYRRLFQSTRILKMRKDRQQLSSDAVSPQTMFESSSQTCKAGSGDCPLGKTRSSESMAESDVQCGSENNQESTMNKKLESFCDENFQKCSNISSKYMSVSDSESCIHDGDSLFGPEDKNLSLPSDEHVDDAVSPQSRRNSYLSPVKEESDSDLSSDAGRSAQDPSLNETFPVFEDNDATPKTTLPRPSTNFSRRRARCFRSKLLYCSVSSDSGIGEVLHGSNTSSSSVCVSTSDSSDCTSSMHSYDSSGASHTDDLDSCEGTASDAFNHDLSSSEELPERSEGDGRPESELHHAGPSTQSTQSQDHITSPKVPRPDSAPLNFRARRKVNFCEETHSDDARSSTSSASSSSSAFLRSFRPILRSQDSEDSASSASSEDSIMAVPLSPASPAHSPFIFPDPSAEKHAFSQPSVGCDLVLLAEGEQFHVHSAVVAWQCNALLQHLRQTGSTEVVLLDKRAADVLCLLRLLYPAQTQPITERNVEGLIGLAHYLGCERVLRLCTTYLIGLAQFSHLCAHTILTPRLSSYLQPTPTRRGGNSSLAKSRISPGRGRFDTSSLCACADTMVERALDILVLAANYELDDVYHTYLEFTAKIPATDITTCSRFKHISATIRQDILMSRLTRLENVVSNVSLKESDLLTCQHQRHDASRLTYSGPLCLRCSSRSLLREAHKSG